MRIARTPWLELTLVVALFTLGLVARRGPLPIEEAMISWLQAGFGGALKPILVPVQVALGAPVWDAGIVCIASGLGLLRRRRAALVVVGALGVEAASLLVKAWFVWPWLFDAGSYAGEGFMVAVPDTATHVVTPPGLTRTGAELRFDIDFATAGRYRVWVRGWADDGLSDSVAIGLDGRRQERSAAVAVQPGPGWTWGNMTKDGSRAELEVGAPGLHVVNIWIRTDRFRLDRIVFDLGPSRPKGQGPPESRRLVARPAEASAAPFVERGERVVVEAEHGRSVESHGGHVWVWRTDRAEADPASVVLHSDFPSAHMARTVVGGGLVCALWDRRRRRRFVWLAAAGALLFVGVCRVVSGAHTPLGVVGGGVLGFGWFRILLELYQRTRRREGPPRVRRPLDRDVLLRGPNGRRRA